MKCFIVPLEENYHSLKINKIRCPFVETLSFGSDINIKCNNSYFIFNETRVSIIDTKKDR